MISDQPLLQEMPKQYNRYEPDDLVAGRPIRTGIFYSLRGSYIYQILSDQTWIINAITGHTLHKIRYNQNAHALSAIYRSQYNYLLVGLSNNTLIEIDCDNFKLGLTYYLNGKPISLSLSDDQSILGIGESNGYIQLVDLIDQQIIQLDIDKQSSSIIFLNIFANNLLITISAEKNMRIYENYRQKQLVAELPGVKAGYTAFLNILKYLKVSGQIQLQQAPDIKAQQLETLMLIADETGISLWMQNASSCIDYNTFFQEGTVLKDQLKQMLSIIGLSTFPGVKPEKQADEAQVPDVIQNFTPFSQVGVFHLDKSRGKIQYISLRDDILLISSTGGIEVFKLNKDVFKQRANRVRRTVKQRLDRIQVQIDKKSTSPEFVQEKAQLFAPIEFLNFRDIFQSVGFVPIRPEQRFIGHDVYYYDQNASQSDQKVIAKLMVEFLDERQQYTVQQIVRDKDVAENSEDELENQQNMQKISKGKKVKKEKMILELVPMSTLNHAHPTVPTCVSLNDEDTLIVAADGWKQLFFTVRRCSLIAAIFLPDNFGKPFAQFILPGGTYTVIISKSGLAVVTNVARQEVESMFQVSPDGIEIVSAQIYNDLLITFSKKGQVAEFSFQMQSEILQLVQERTWDSQYEISTVLITPQLTFFALTDGSIRIHHRDTFKFKMALYGHSLAVSQLIISPTTEKLFTLSQGDKTIRAWGLTFGECLRIMKLQDQPLKMTLIAGTNNVIVGTNSGKLLQYDLDTYEEVAVLSEGNFGAIKDPGHVGAVTDITSSRNGKLVVSAGSDGCKTWIQGDDVFTSAGERVRREEQQLEVEPGAGGGGGSGQKWTETLHGAHIDSLDLLQQVIETCYQKYQAGNAVNDDVSQAKKEVEALKMDGQSSTSVAIQLYKLQERATPWEVELSNVLFGRLSRAALPELIRALPFGVAEKLKSLLLTRLSTGSLDERISWAFLRLARGVFAGNLGNQQKDASKIVTNVFDKLINLNGACLGMLEGFLE